VAWGELSRLAERDPDAMNAAWTRIKEAAWAELKSGHRAARALERGGRPWDRARFLAVREAFRADWCPRGGIEDALIDTLAQSYATYLEWTARLHVRAAADGATEDAELKREGTWRPPRLTTAQATEQSAAMAERAHRMFLRTLRALQDLRRSPSVAIAAAGQVNIGAQQVNVAAPAEGDAAEGTPARRTP
jgi:hypothetical protein